MTANHPVGHTLVGKPVHAPFLPITYTQRMNAGQIPWVAGFQKAPFDRFM
jgi:hypothetical protein